MLQNHTERLGTAPLPSLLFRLSLPSIAATVTTSLYNVVDTFWVGRLGQQAIAALTIVFPYQILAVALGVGTGAGVSALVSRRFGESNVEATNHAAGQVFFLSAFWGVLLLLVASIFHESILGALGATQDFMEPATAYLVVVSYGAPAHVFILVTGNLIRGSGDAVKPMVMMITASVLNMVLDPFIILGWGPFPALGVTGAAIATVMAQSTGMLIGFYYLLGRRTTFRIRLPHITPNLRLVVDICRVGMPASVQEIMESVSFAIFYRLLSVYGSVAIAAIGIVMRAADLTFMPVIGVANALLPVVGYNFGAGNEKRLWSAVRLSCFGIAALLLLLTVIYEVFAPQIIGIFVDDPKCINTAVPAMRIGIMTISLIGPTVMFVTTFQGLSRGTTALLLSLTRQFLIFVPLLFLFNHLWELMGLWIAMPVADAAGFAVCLFFVLREYRRRAVPANRP